jgi:WD40 repeat protein
MSADGRWLMAPNADGVHVWDFAADRLAYFHPAKDAYSALFSADGKSVIASSGRELWKWPLVEHEDEPGFTLGPFTLLATFLQRPFFPNTTVSGPGREWLTFDEGTRVWTVNRNDIAAKVVLKGKDTGIIAAISPDTNWLVTTHWKDGTTKVWDTRSGQEACDLGEQGGSVAFSPDGRWLLVGSGAEYAFHETGSWRKSHVVPRESVNGLVGQSAFSRDGRMLALALTQRIVQIVDPNTGREIVSLTPPSPQNLGWLAFGPHDQTFMAAAAQGEIHIWDLGNLRRELAAMNLDWKD